MERHHTMQKTLINFRSPNIHKQNYMYISYDTLANQIKIQKFLKVHNILHIEQKS